MKRTPVRSSNIKSVGFADGELHVEFSNGKVFKYTGPKVEEHYKGLMAAESIGKYFYAHVKSCKATACEAMVEAPAQNVSADSIDQAG